MENKNLKPKIDVVPAKGVVDEGEGPEKGPTNPKGPATGGGKSFYTRFLSAISSPTEAENSSRPAGARSTRPLPLDEGDVSSSASSEGEDRDRAASTKAPPKASDAERGKACPSRGESAVSRNLRLRQYLSLADLSEPTTSSDEEERTAPKKPQAKPPAATKAPEVKRGRGRPPTTGEYVGLADAKRKLLEVEREALQLQTEKEIVEQASAMATARATRSKTIGALASQAAPEARVEHAEGLQRQIADSLAVVAGVAKVSKGLKGTLQKALKEAVASVQEATEELLGRTDTEEVALLRAANRRMEAELADLRGELTSIRSELAECRARAVPSAPPPPEPTPPTTTAANLDHLVLLMENRFAALEERLRPAPMPSPTPRARPTPPPSPSLLPGPSVEEYPPLPSRRVNSETAVADLTPPPPTCPAPLPPPAAAGEGWTTVAKKKKQPKKAKAPSASAAPVAPAAADAASSAKRRRNRGGKGRRKGGKAQEKSSQPPPPPPPPPKKEKARDRRAPRIRAPKSSAVVLTIQPGVDERRVTYANILSRAKANIRLSELGIEGGLRLKVARTGARMLVLPGADSAPKADALAEALRTVLDEEQVRVSRPEKTVSLRVSGLDDCTHAEDVAAAIARTTNCPVGSIRASKIRPGPDGMGTTVVACPVAAAKKLQEGKLLVGWASAEVKALPHRAQRCFRCHEVGHVAARCTSEVDRSGLCYRCGQAGHLVTGPCTAKPHCSVCEAAGRPAGHQLGGGPCKARKPTRRGSRMAPDKAAAGKPAAAASTEA